MTMQARGEYRVCRICWERLWPGTYAWIEERPYNAVRFALDGSVTKLVAVSVRYTCNLCEKEVTA